MKLQILGDGSFGSFLKELLKDKFEICDDADTVILAVPISAYDECGAKFKDRHLVNVCSVQSVSMKMLLRHTIQVTGIHPLFGRRTPSDKRNSILTFECGSTLEAEFLEKFVDISKIIDNTLVMDKDWKPFTPELHDELMLKTHVAAVLAAKQLKPFIEAAKDVSDLLIPNSFRLMREFVKTLDDMPKGTLESIMANPYI